MISVQNTVKQTIKIFVPHGVYSSVRNGLRFIVSFKYSGDKYECPFCKGHFSTFLPAGLNIPVLKEKQVVGGGYRLNSTCPRCYSEDRERLIYLYLKKEKQYVFSTGIKLLHIAPELNLAVKLKSNPYIDYISADLYSPMADIQMDITDIKQPDNTYDVIICNHVLEHIDDDSRAMTELFRVLKKDGFAILQVPISYSIEKTLENSSITNPEDRERVYGQKDHVRIYGSDYKLRLKKAGFSVIEHRFAEDMESQGIKNFGLLKDERLFVCSKSLNVAKNT